MFVVHEKWVETRTDCYIDPNSSLDHSSISFASWLSLLNRGSLRAQSPQSALVLTLASCLQLTRTARAPGYIIFLRQPASAVLPLIYSGASLEWRLCHGSIYNICTQFKSTLETINYGMFISQFRLDIVIFIRWLARIKRKWSWQKMPLLFNQTCLNEEMLPIHTHIHPYIYIYQRHVRVINITRADILNVIYLMHNSQSLLESLGQQKRLQTHCTRRYRKASTTKYSTAILSAQRQVI